MTTTSSSHSPPPHIEDPERRVIHKALWSCSVPEDSYVGSWILAVEPEKGRWESLRERHRGVL